MATTYNDLTLDIRRQLRQAGIEAATLEARELVCFAAGKDKARLLRDGGRFAVCHRPQQLARVLAALTAARLEPKRLQFVKQAPDAAPWLFLCEAQKNRRPGLTVLPDLLPGQYPHY